MGNRPEDGLMAVHGNIACAILELMIKDIGCYEK